MSFKNKKIVITGAGRDFGQTLSLQFAKMGAEIFLSARTLAAANRTADLIKEVVPAAKISTFQADIAKPADIAKFAVDVSQMTAEIDILVNNAAYWLEGNISEASDDGIIEAINSTATGSMLITKHFLPLLKNSDGADIVFINSTASLENNTHAICNEAFSAAKAAQSTFSDRLRNRIKGSGMRLTCIYPPDFDNTSSMNVQDWNEQRGHNDTRFLTARNIFDSIKFCLSQDRKCSIDKIILSNNAIQ